ncbi:MAG: GH3 auxin-responsive promoter family protein, partial [Bacteroidia bacterium]|nr:GH3 auxin-responsive promoter family protein [Bacteroidia bacterium]
MPILNSIASWWMRKRMHQIDLFMKYPHDVQEEWFRRLIEQAKYTEWGKKYDYNTIETYRQFNERIPLQDYDTIKPFIERARRGEQNVLWPGETNWFAKSSGTTSDKSKFIPVTENSLEESHYNGGRDMVAIHCSNRPETMLFTGKNLALAGSYQVDKYGQHESYHGDLSAIVIRNLPLWAEFLRSPDLSIALIDEWEKKLDKMARATMDENVTS